MILKRFFKPKWQHPNPQVRLQALQELAGGDAEIFAQMAQQDLDPEVRCAALKRISEIEVLKTRVDQETDPRVRGFAEKQLRDVLTGQMVHCPSVAVRVAAVQSLDKELAEFIAVHGKEPELRLAMVERLQSQCLLSSMVLNDPAVNVRLVALERVLDPVHLEKIAKQSRHRDKRVYRKANERLQALQAKQAHLANARQVCGELEQLTWDGEAGSAAARFAKLEKAWQGLQPSADVELQARYEKARDCFLEQRQEVLDRRGQRLAILKRLEDALLAWDESQQLTSALQSELQAILSRAQQDWLACGDLHDKEGKRLAARFDQLLQKIHDKERILRRNGERAGQLSYLLQQAGELLQQPSEVLEADIKSLKQRWAGLERPQNETLTASLQGDFDALLDKLKLRLQRQAEHKVQELTDLETLLAELEKTLENGELQQAIALYDRTQHRLKHNIGLSRKQMKALEGRLHACHPRLAELRGWRRWGIDQAREQLCEAAEQLAEQTGDPLAIAQQIKQLRNTWKGLDGTGGAAPRNLWKRFDQACERAYEPCQAYFDAQTQERQHNLKKKQALCERLEYTVANTDWNQVDWHWADRTYRELSKEGYKIGPVNRSDRKAIERRYQKALKSFDECLKKEREQELRRRKELIEQIRQLAKSDALQAAVNGAKRAQAQWQPTVQASRREEQILWRQFRSVCDGVFAQRQSEQQAAEAEREENLTRKSALCEELEKLASVDSAGIQYATRRVQEAQDEWRNIGPVSKAAYKAIEQRFEAASSQLKKRQRVLRQQQARAELESLRTKARLCQRLEETLMEPDSRVEGASVVAETRQTWDTLAVLPGRLEQSIQERFDHVCQALSGDDEASQRLHQAVAKTLQQKQLLCLQIEVLAGLESPPEYQQARMEYQVARLSESLHSRETASSPAKVHEETHEIERQWYLLPSLSPAQNEAFEKRFERAQDALLEQRGY
jgi:hypothetical protein